MKFTLSWLREHLDTEAFRRRDRRDPHRPRARGRGGRRPARHPQGLHPGKNITGPNPTPTRDRLRVCMVETDEGEKQIICGAPNAREGITVVVCKPGDYVPGIDTPLSVGKIPGVESHGMMASERELELSPRA